ncbi:MAG TPA: hypothetical protein VF076_07160 [Acidimicrobiales bacterium]
MSPDQPTAEPAAAPAPVPTTEPAQGAAGPRLNSLEDAFRQAPEALKGSEGERRAQAGSDAPGASAAPAADGQRAASKPGEDPGGVSRRGAAAKISEQQQEIDRLVAEREAERSRAAQVTASMEAQQRQRAGRAQAAMARIGDDREFADLSTKRMRGEVLSYEQDEKLNSMLAWREHAADLWEIADRAHKQAIVAGLGDRTERYGLDRQVAYDAPLPDLLDHAVSVTEARVRKETANEIAELKAELRGWKTRGAGGTAPTVGGSSTPGGVAVPGPGASPMDFFRAGAQQAEVAANGSRATRS